MKRLLTLVLTFAICLSMLAGCMSGGASTPPPAAGDEVVFTYARAEDIQNWDPLNNNNIVNGWAYNLIYDFLVINNYDGTYSPSLATEWSPSADGLTWTFKLRDDVTFQNGQKLTSDDVKTTFDRVIEDKSLLRASNFTSFESISCPDDYTVEFHLSSPSGVMLMVLSTFPVCSGEQWREKGTDMFKENIGTGPWKFVSWDPGQQIVFERAESYWGECTSNCDRIIYKNITEDTTRVSGLRTGELDFIDSVPADQKELLSGEGFVMDSTLSMDQLLVGFRCVDSVFADFNVRQALNHAIDRQALVESIMQGGRAASWPVGKGVNGFDESSPVPEYNVELAKEYLEKSGYQGETINLIGPIGNYPRIDEILQAVTSMLMDAGFAVKLEPLEGAAFQQRRQEGKYDVYITGCSMAGGDPGTNITQRWKGDSLNSGYKNEELNALIDRSNEESDPAKRTQYLREAMAFSWENLAPWTTILQMDYNCAYKEGVSGVVIRGDKYVFARDVVKN